MMVWMRRNDACSPSDSPKCDPDLGQLVLRQESEPDVSQRGWALLSVCVWLHVQQHARVAARVKKSPLVKVMVASWKKVQQFLWCNNIRRANEAVWVLNPNRIQRNRECFQQILIVLDHCTFYTQTEDDAKHGSCRVEPLWFWMMESEFDEKRPKKMLIHKSCRTEWVYWDASGGVLGAVAGTCHSLLRGHDCLGSDSWH